MPSSIFRILKSALLVRRRILLQGILWSVRVCSPTYHLPSNPLHYDKKQVANPTPLDAYSDSQLPLHSIAERRQNAFRQCGMRLLRVVRKSQ